MRIGETDRRLARRFIMRVPLKFRITEESALSEQTVESLNISRRGVYFATDLQLKKGLPVQVRLTMPEEIIGCPATEWGYTCRVVHVEPLGGWNRKWACSSCIMSSTSLRIPGFPPNNHSHLQTPVAMEYNGPFACPKLIAPRGVKYTGPSAERWQERITRMRAETRSLKNSALGLMGLLVFLLFGTPLAAQERDWVFLGESHVDGPKDHDRIKVGRYPESFRAIQFRVEGGDVEFDRIKVHFRNGMAADRLMHVRIPAGGRSRAIDLPGERRIIESVEVWYRNTGPHVRPTVSLFGER